MTTQLASPPAALEGLLSSTDFASVSPSVELLRILKLYGVEVVFTVTGGPLMPFLQACRQEQLATVVCRQETNAVIAASAYYQAKAVPALVALTSGPGAANAVNGCLFALREHAAVFVVSARPAGPKLGRGAVQDLDSAALLRPVTKHSEQLLHPHQVHHLSHHLMATALAPNPGPVNLTVACHQW
jgi:acetolactate synthase I/II/III large subunit